MSSSGAPAAAASLQQQQQPRKLKLPVRTNVLIEQAPHAPGCAAALAAKPASEHWLLLASEAIAQAVAAAAASACADTTTVRTVGGCVCCAQAGVLVPLLAQSVRQCCPDRLLVLVPGGPGPGSVASLLDILQGPNLGSALQLHAVVCTVDLAAFDAAVLLSDEASWQQMVAADILVGSNAGEAPPGTAAAFQRWAASELQEVAGEKQVLLQEQQLSLACLEQPRRPQAAAGGGAPPQLLVKPRGLSSRARQQQQQQLALQARGSGVNKEPDSVGAAALDGV